MLDVSHNQITTIHILFGQTIKILYLDHNLITDIKTLPSVWGIASVSLDNNTITDISPLNDISSLQVLSIYNNNLTSIQPMIIPSGHTALHQFYVSEGNSIPADEITAFEVNHPGCTVY